MPETSKKNIRYTLGILLLLVALNAFAGGYYGMTGAEGVPVQWLAGSPFRNYFIPGLFLFAVIGSLALVAAIAVFRQSELARKITFFCVVVILAWLAVQVSIIGYVSWMQPVTATIAILILFLQGNFLKGIKK
ncbi:MAG TPA: hypothetical protein VMU83_15265 [Hanamia sp.]|nr:hypothetical protein [Hanamia sp.]